VRLGRRLFQLLVVIDQAFNVIGGSGWADETISAYAHRKNDWRSDFLNAIFRWQPDPFALSD